MFERGSWRWRISVLAIPGLIVATIVVSQPLVGDRLPDRLATGWNPAGVPSGSMSGVAIVAMLTFFAAVIWLATVFFGSRRVPGPEILGMAYAIGAILAGGQIAVIAANLDATTWEQAASIGNAHWVVYGVAIAAALVGTAFAGGPRGFGRADGA